MYSFHVVGTSSARHDCVVNNNFRELHLEQKSQGTASSYQEWDLPAAHTDQGGNVPNPLRIQLSETGHGINSICVHNFAAFKLTMRLVAIFPYLCTYIEHKNVVLALVYLYILEIQSLVLKLFESRAWLWKCRSKR